MAMIYRWGGLLSLPCGSWLASVKRVEEKGQRNKVRGQTMHTSSIVMMVIGLGFTWGGAVICLKVAMEKQ